MRKTGILLQVLVILALAAGCGSAPSAVPTDTQVAASTAAPTNTPVIPPTATQTPSPTPLPTQTPTPTQTPLPWADAKIGVESAGNLVELQRWGRGVVLSHQYSRDGESLFVLTGLGFEEVHPQTLERRQFYPGVTLMFYAPDQQVLTLCRADSSCLFLAGENWQLAGEMEPVAQIPKEVSLELDPETPSEQIEDMLEYFQMAVDVSISTDGSMAAIGYRDGSIAVFSLAEKKLLQVLRHDVVGEIFSVAFSPDANQVLFSARRGWNLAILGLYKRESSELAWYQVTYEDIGESPFTPDGQYFITNNAANSSMDRYVVLRSVESGEKVGQVSGQAAPLAFSPDSTLLVVSSYQSVRLVQLPQMYVIKTLETGLDWPPAEFDETGENLIVNRGEQIWSLSDYQSSAGVPKQYASEVMPAPEYKHWVESGFYNNLAGTGLSLQGEPLVWGGKDTDYYVQTLFSLQTDWVKFTALPMSIPALTPDGSRMAACTEAGLEVANLQDGSLQVFGRCLPPGAIAFSPDGKIVARSSRTSIELIDPTTGELVQTFVGASKPVVRLEFSLDGSLFVSNSGHSAWGVSEIMAWQVDPPKSLPRGMEQRNGAITDAAFSLVDGLLATGSFGDLRVWRLADGHQLDFRIDPRPEAASLEFSPDGTLIFLGQADGNLAVWKTEKLEPLAEYPAHQDAVFKVVFVRDGTNLLCASRDGVISLWGVR